jgi:hypothetical protein
MNAISHVIVELKIRLDSLRNSPLFNYTSYRYSWNGSPACLKVRSLLNYFNYPYKLIEVDLATKSEIKWPAMDYNMVPQVSFGKKRICDVSSVLVS